MASIFEQDQPRGNATGLGRHPLAGKTTWTLVVLTIALGLPYTSPSLRRLRLIEAPWEADPPENDIARGVQAATIAPEGMAGETEPRSGEQTLPASENTATINNALPDESGAVLPDIPASVRGTLKSVALEDPGGHALDAFFARLARTRDGQTGAVTRVLHYGDSTIASDYISGTVRRRLQARYGDAGHGFILIANPWEWYFHNDVQHASDGEWRASRLSGPTASDARYGLGGVSFTSYGGGVAWFGTASRGDFGRRVARFDLFYLEQPGGGDVELTIRGGATVRFSTRGDARVSRVRSLSVEDGEARLAVHAIGRGPVRLFGVALERERPGVVYDALGAHAAMAIYWKRQNRDHWREQLALRDPALIVLEYGTNESDLWRLDRDAYEQALGELVDELREIAPDASLLVLAPLDRGERRYGQVATKRVILDLVEIQKRVALSHGAAFWNTFDAMGGPGSMGRWVRARPQLGGEDLTHPTPLGAEVIGDMLSDALIASFEHWSAGSSEAVARSPSEARDRAPQERERTETSWKAESGPTGHN